MIWKIQISWLEGICSSIVSIYYKHSKDEHYQSVCNKPNQIALLLLPAELSLPTPQHSVETFLIMKSSFIDYSSIQQSLA